MTTIAYDGKTISSESRMTIDGMICEGDCFSKMIIPCKNKLNVDLITVNGDANYLPRFLRFIEGDCEYPFTKDEEYEVLIVISGEVYTLCLNAGWDARIKSTSKIIAHGSGREFAMGAMFAGKSSAEAVAISCRLDCYSGGIINTYNLKEKTLT